MIRVHLRNKFHFEWILHEGMNSDALIMPEYLVKRFTKGMPVWSIATFRYVWIVSAQQQFWTVKRKTQLMFNYV